MGCLVIGLLYGYAERWYFPKEWRLFLATGLLGGFTTFSAFSNETVTLFQNGQTSYAVTYIILSIVAGLTATLLGLLVMRMI